MLPTQPTTFSFPTPIRFGAGVVRELAAHLKSQNLRRPLIVTDSFLARLPRIVSLLADLKKAGLEAQVFSDIHKNPVKSDVEKGGKTFHELKTDAIVGLGGGASLDVARAIALRVHHPDDLFKYDDLIGGDIYVTEAIPYFVTVPTTAGTGSEVGRSAIISDDETHQKKILFSPRLMAKIVFADPELTLELPPPVTAATGMDALTHNIEAYLAKNFHPICDGIALEGLRLIARYLKRAVTEPDLESRAGMLLASMMGAIAFQKGLGVVHSTAHPLSSKYDTHHGLANAVMIPYGIEYNSDVSSVRLATLAGVIGLRQPSAKAVVAWLHELNAQIGIPSRLGALGVPECDLEELADLAFADFAHPNNPKPVSRADFLKIYQKAL